MPRQGPFAGAAWFITSSALADARVKLIAFQPVRAKAAPLHTKTFALPFICDGSKLMYGGADPMKVENLRSPYVKTGGLYYFARMIDKIRLNSARLLPADYQQVLGLGFDGRTCRFLRVDYKEFAERVLQGGTDEELLQWCLTRGHTPTDEEISMWNDWVRKKGWRDETSARLKKRLKESGFEDRTDIETMFDYLDLDEGRDPRHRNWDYTREYE